jgi:transcriptional regulator with XRE-family HTH domain
MARPFAELEARLTPKERKLADKFYAKLTKEMALHEIRTAAGLSQDEMAARLKVGQAQVSKIESRNDVRVSTIAKYLRAAGGRLRMVADLDGRLIELTSFGNAELSPPRAGKLAAPAKAKPGSRARSQEPAKKAARSRPQTRAKRPKPTALGKRA